MALDLNSFAPALKTLYPKGVPLSLTLKDNPFWAMVEKKSDFFGANLTLPFRYADPQNGSRTFATALAGRATGNSKLKAAVLYRGRQYGAVQIDRETILASANDAGAFLAARKMEIDGMLNEMGRRIGIDLFADGSGIRSSINDSNYASTTSYTLANADDVTNFEVGQQIGLTAAIPAFGVAATPVGTTANPYIVAIDRDAGKLSFSLTVGGAPTALMGTGIFTGLTNSTQYFIFLLGDNVATGATSPSTSAIVGLGAWLPVVAPVGGDNFFGIDRSADASRLAGVRFNGTGLPLEELFIKAAARVARDGGRPDTVIMNYSQWANFSTSLGSKVRYTEKSVGDVGFTTLQISGPKGELTVVPDQNCPIGKAYMLQMDTWCFHHLEECPSLITIGNVGGALQEATADAIQVRAAALGQLMCTAPGYNAVITLDT